MTWFSFSPKSSKARGGKRGRESARGKKMPFTCCVYSLHVCEISYRYTHQNHSEMLAWCRYDRPQVVYRSIFAENCARATVKNSPDSDSHHECLKQTHTASGYLNLLTWMPKWKAKRQARHTCCSRIQRRQSVTLNLMVPDDLLTVYCKQIKLHKTRQKARQFSDLQELDNCHLSSSITVEIFCLGQPKIPLFTSLNYGHININSRGM